MGRSETVTEYLARRLKEVSAEVRAAKQVIQAAKADCRDAMEALRNAILRIQTLEAELEKARRMRVNPAMGMS